MTPQGKNIECTNHFMSIANVNIILIYIRIQSAVFNVVVFFHHQSWRHIRLSDNINIAMKHQVVDSDSNLIAVMVCEYQDVRWLMMMTKHSLFVDLLHNNHKIDRVQDSLHMYIWYTPNFVLFCLVALVVYCGCDFRLVSPVAMGFDLSI